MQSIWHSNDVLTSNLRSLQLLFILFFPSSSYKSLTHLRCCFPRVCFFTGFERSSRQAAERGRRYFDRKHRFVTSAISLFNRPFVKSKHEHLPQAIEKLLTFTYLEWKKFTFSCAFLFVCSTKTKRFIFLKHTIEEHLSFNKCIHCLLYTFVDSNMNA